MEVVIDRPGAMRDQHARLAIEARPCTAGMVRRLVLLALGFDAEDWVVCVDGGAEGGDDDRVLEEASVVARVTRRVVAVEPRGAAKAATAAALACVAAASRDDRHRRERGPVIPKVDLEAMRMQNLRPSAAAAAAAAATVPIETSAPQFAQHLKTLTAPISSETPREVHEEEYALILRAIADGDDAQLRAVLSRDPSSKTVPTRIIKEASAAGQTGRITKLLECSPEGGATEALYCKALLLAVHDGHTQLCHELVARGACRKGPYYVSPLLVAVERRRRGLCELLVDGGCGADDGEVPPLLWAAKLGYPEMCAELVRVGADVNMALDRLYSKVQFNRATGLEHVDLPESICAGATPLLLAARDGHTATCTALLGAGADVRAQWCDGKTALHSAAALAHDSRGGQLAIVRALLAAGCDVDATCESRATALVFAASTGSDDVVDLLCAAGADVDLANFEGTTPLIAAVRSHLQYSTYSTSAASIARLVAAGADPHCEDARGMSALQHAVGRGALDLCDILVAPDALRRPGALDDAYAALCAAAELGHTDICRQLVTVGGADLNYVPPPPPAATLTKVGLLEHEAAVAAGGERGRARTGGARGGSSGGAAARMVARKQRPSTTRKKTTAAAASGVAPKSARRKPVAGKASATLTAPRSEKAATPSPTPPPVAAAAVAAQPTGELLPQAPPQHRTIPNDSEMRAAMSPLMVAARAGHAALCQVLVALGADADATTPCGWTALRYAVVEGYVDVVEALAATGADVHGNLRQGWTLLMLAAQEGRRDVAELLVEKCGVDPLVRNSTGCTAMYIAAVRGWPAVVDALVDACGGDAAGAGVEMPAADGTTPLLAAARQGHELTCVALLDRGADGAAGMVRDSAAAGAAGYTVLDTLLRAGWRFDDPKEVWRVVRAAAARGDAGTCARLGTDCRSQPHNVHWCPAEGEVAEDEDATQTEEDRRDREGTPVTLSFAPPPGVADRNGVAQVDGTSDASPPKKKSKKKVPKGMAGAGAAKTKIPGARRLRDSVGADVVEGSTQPRVAKSKPSKAARQASEDKASTRTNVASRKSSVKKKKRRLEPQPRPTEIRGCGSTTALARAERSPSPPPPATHRPPTRAEADWASLGAEADAAFAIAPGLLVAAAKGHVDACVALLCAPGSEAARAGATGWTALHFAVLHGHTAVATELLLCNNVDKHAATRSGWTPLMLAAYLGRATLCRALLEVDADAGTRRPTRETAAFYAAARGHYAIANALIDVMPEGREDAMGSLFHDALVAAHDVDINTWLWGLDGHPGVELYATPCTTDEATMLTVLRRGYAAHCRRGMPQQARREYPSYCGRWRVFEENGRYYARVNDRATRPVSRRFFMEAVGFYMRRKVPQPAMRLPLGQSATSVPVAPAPAGGCSVGGGGGIGSATAAAAPAAHAALLREKLARLQAEWEAHPTVQRLGAGNLGAVAGDVSEAGGARASVTPAAAEPPTPCEVDVDVDAVDTHTNGGSPRTSVLPPPALDLETPADAGPRAVVADGAAIPTRGAPCGRDPRHAAIEHLIHREAAKLAAVAVALGVPVLVVGAGPAPMRLNPFLPYLEPLPTQEQMLRLQRDLPVAERRLSTGAPVLAIRQR